MGEPTGSEFPSITRRSEQAAQTQAQVNEIAMKGGWQQPSPDDLPKSGSNDNLPEGTPLANSESLTPGQHARLKDLPKPPTYTPGGAIRVDTIDRWAHEDDKNRSKLLGAAAQDVPKPRKLNGPIGLPVMQEAFSAQNALDGMWRQSRAMASSDDVGQEVALGQMLDEKFGPDTVSDRRPFDRANDIHAALPKAERRREFNRNDVRDERKAVDRQRSDYAENITTARDYAADLYDLNPERYQDMNTTDFVKELRGYEQLHREKQSNEMEAEDLESTIRTIEYYRSEGGDTPGNALGVERLTGIAMQPSDTLQGYFDAVLASLRERVDRFKVTADERRREIAAKYGPNAGQTQPTLGVAQPPVAPEQPRSPIQPDEHMDDDHDGIVRGYN